jgi:hypothetical protein
MEQGLNLKHDFVNSPLTMCGMYKNNFIPIPKEQVSKFGSIQFGQPIHSPLENSERTKPASERRSDSEI